MAFYDMKKMFLSLVMATNIALGVFADVPVPTGLVAEISSENIPLSWNAVLGADAYEVWRGTTDDVASAVRIASADSASFSDSDTTAGVTYRYWVCAVDGTAKSDFSEMTTGVRYPRGVEQLRAESGVSGIVISWVASPDATRYTVWRQDASDGGNSCTVGVTESTSIMDTNATVGVEYLYWVGAHVDDPEMPGFGFVSSSGAVHGAFGVSEPEPEPPQAWTVTFNANGGEGTMAAQTFTNGVAQALSANAFTRFGYDFAGWATSADGEVVYADGQRIAVTSGQTLYARWAEIVADRLNVSFAKAQTVLGALYGKDGVPMGTVQVKVGKISKKGVVKISATATVLVDGKAKKIAAKAVDVAATSAAAPVNIAFAAPIGEMAFELEADGTFTLKNASYVMAEKKVGGNWSKAGARVYVAATSAAAPAAAGTAAPHTALPAGTIEELLPDGEPVIPKAGKWSFAKAAGVKWAKPKKGAERPEIYDAASGKGLIVDTSKGKTNLSGLKLTYTPKTGIFNGSFKIYAIQGGKLKKITVKVIGVVVDGKGWGSAAVPKGARLVVTVE